MRSQGESKAEIRAQSVSKALVETRFQIAYIVFSKTNGDDKTSGRERTRTAGERSVSILLSSHNLDRFKKPGSWVQDQGAQYPSRILNCGFTHVRYFFTLYLTKSRAKNGIKSCQETLRTRETEIQQKVCYAVRLDTELWAKWKFTVICL